MLQSIKRAYRIEPDNPRLHCCLINFHLSISQMMPQLQEPVTTVLSREMSSIYNSKSPSTLNDEFLSRHPNSLPHIYAGAKMLCQLDSSKQEEAIKMVYPINTAMKGVKVQVCKSILQSLQNGDFGDCDSSAESYKTQCHQYFKHCTSFQDIPSSSSSTENIALEVKQNCVDS